MFRRILIPLDGSERAERVLAHAINIARWLEAEITILHVLSPMHGARGGIGQIKYPDAMHDRGVTLVTGYLQEIVDHIGDAGVRIRTGIVTGEAAETIAERAGGGGFGMIALTYRSTPEMMRRFRTSVFDGVWSRTTVPLLIVNSASDAPQGQTFTAPQRIIVPLDGTRSAEWALPYAKRIAVAANLGVTLVRALRPRLGGTLRLGRLMNGSERVANAYLEDKADELRENDLAVETSVTRGQSGAGLAVSGQVEHNGLVVIASRLRTGWSGFLLGSVAREVIQRASGPVIVVPVGRPRRDILLAGDESTGSALADGLNPRNGHG